MNSRLRASALSFASIGMLSLTGCAGGADTEAFCDFATNIQERFIAVESEPSQEAMVAAQGGDFEQLNEWGAQAGEDVQELRDDLATAVDGAPDEGSAQALELFEAATDTVYEVTQLAADSDDLQTFLADAEQEYVALEDQLAAVDEDPEVTLAAKTDEHCAAE